MISAALATKLARSYVYVESSKGIIWSTKK